LDFWRARGIFLASFLRFGQVLKTCGHFNAKPVFECLHMIRHQKFEKKKKNFHALIRASSHENLPFFKKKLHKKREKICQF
jgi:hypothetical protein